MPESPLILVVEDEYLLLDEMLHALTRAGFVVDGVGSGEEALALFCSGRDYAALITDVNLQGALSGWDVARRVRERERSLPVIYTTGAAADQWASQGVPDSTLLAKPFAPAQLLSAVSRLLKIDATAPHAASARVSNS